MLFFQGQISETCFSPKDSVRAFSPWPSAHGLTPWALGPATFCKGFPKLLGDVFFRYFFNEALLAFVGAAVKLSLHHRSKNWNYCLGSTRRYHCFLWSWFKTGNPRNQKTINPASSRPLGKPRHWNHAHFVDLAERFRMVVLRPLHDLIRPTLCRCKGTTFCKPRFRFIRFPVSLVSK